MANVGPQNEHELIIWANHSRLRRGGCGGNAIVGYAGVTPRNLPEEKKMKWQIIDLNLGYGGERTTQLM